MADKEEKKKGGAKKFFLGAILGGIAGAVAGRFITAKAEEASEGHGCNCDGECHCDEEETPVKKTAEKKSSEKK